MTISETFSLEECGYGCIEIHAATMFRLGKHGSPFCSRQNQCHCTCVMDANPDTCVIILTEGMNLYKNSTAAGNCIVSLCENPLYIDQFFI